MTRLHRTLIALATVSSLSLAGQAMADDMHLKAFYGKADFELTGIPIKPLTTDMNIAGVSLSSVTPGFDAGFWDISYRQSLSATHGYYANVPEQDFNHRQWSASFGALTSSNWAFSFSIAGTSNEYKAPAGFDKISGIGYSLNVNKAFLLGENAEYGALSLNGSLGYMAGNWETPTTDNDGTAFIYSYGAGYKKSLGKTWALGVDYKVQKNKWDFSLSNSSIEKPEETFKMKTISLTANF